MEDIKYKFSNLNSQLDLYLNDKKQYLDAFKNGQIVDIPEVGDGKYTYLYTNKGQFSIEENGDIGFTIEGEYNKYNDVVGNYNVNNNIYDTHMLKSAYNAELNGTRGLEFNRTAEKNATAATLKQTGFDGVWTATRSDFGIDDEYILPNGQKAGKLTFEAMFTGGMLADKYYDGSLTGTPYKKGDSSWFWDKKNSKDLTNLIAEYSTDVNEYMNKQGLEKYSARKSSQTKPAAIVIGGSQYNAQTFNSSFVPYINKLAKLKEGGVETSPTGVKFTVKGGKYYRVDGMQNGKPVVDENQGAMTLDGVGSYEGWGNYVNLNKPELK